MRSSFGIAACVLLPTLLCCCDSNQRYMTRERLNRGLVIILPGIEGEGPLNYDIRRGLLASGVYRGLPIHSWGRPVPIAGPLLNQMDIIGNRLAAAHIADIVASYQKDYPGRPVHLIGHSGGGGIAVFAAEALPEGVSVDGLILLSPSISSAYDLTKAMAHCRNGILNIFTRSDVGLLVIGTTLAGNVDGIRGPAAGALGFDRPGPRSPPEKINAYQRLYQLELTKITDEGLAGAHGYSTRWTFIARYIVPWLLSPSWPPKDAPGVAEAIELQAKALAQATR